MSGEETQRLRDQTHRELVYRPFQFYKRSQLFICVHNRNVFRRCDAHQNLNRDFDRLFVLIRKGFRAASQTLIYLLKYLV